jgi:hypothetical protein
MFVSVSSVSESQRVNIEILWRDGYWTEKSYLFMCLRTISWRHTQCAGKAPCSGRFISDTANKRLRDITPSRTGVQWNFSTLTKCKGKCKVNQAPLQEDVYANGGTDPPFFTSALDGVFSFTFWPLYPGERDHGTHWIECWVGLRAGLDVVAYGKSCPCRDTKLGRCASSIVTIPTDLSRVSL